MIWISLHTLLYSFLHLSLLFGPFCQKSRVPAPFPFRVIAYNVGYNGEWTCDPDPQKVQLVTPSMSSLGNYEGVIPNIKHISVFQTFPEPLSFEYSCLLIFTQQCTNEHSHGRPFRNSIWNYCRRCQMWIYCQKCGSTQKLKFCASRKCRSVHKPGVWQSPL